MKYFHGSTPFVFKTKTKPEEYELYITLCYNVAHDDGLQEVSVTEIEWNLIFLELLVDVDLIDLVALMFTCPCLMLCLTPLTFTKPFASKIVFVMFNIQSVIPQFIILYLCCVRSH